MPTQSPEVRKSNFSEVALGYSEETAIKKALRCLNCKNMSRVSGCPVNIHIPRFIEKVKEGDFEAAYEIISEALSLPAVCGRVCPQETQYKSKCVRGIKGEPVGIERLERFVADWHNAHSESVLERVESNGKNVAVVGGGNVAMDAARMALRLGAEKVIYCIQKVAGGTSCKEGRGRTRYGGGNRVPAP